jgi:hypothetical protein
MAKYLAMHQVTPHMSIDDASVLILGVIQRLTPDIQWLRYWYCDDNGKMVCLWSAQSAAAVWAIVRAAGVPTSDVFEVEEGDPALLQMGQIT